MSQSPEGLSFRDAAIWDDLGGAPCTVSLPAAAWGYGAVSQAIDFAGLGGDALVILLVEVRGADLGVSIVSEDGSTLLTEEVRAYPAEALQSVVLRVPAAVGTGLVLLRNYGCEGQAGRVEVRAAALTWPGNEEAARLSRLWSIFDADWYAARHTDLDAGARSAFDHYIERGAGMPNALFDAPWYLAAHPEAAAHPGGAVGYFLEIGAARDDDPSPAFSSRWYRDENLVEPDVPALAHYIRVGRRRGLAPRLDALDYRLHDAHRDGPVIEAADWLAAFPADSRVSLPLEAARRYAAEHNAILHPPAGEAPPPAPEAPPSPYVARLDDVIVQGGAELLVTAGGAGLHDELAYVEDHYPADSKSYAVARLPGRRILLRAPAAPIPVDQGVHLMNEADANYFHWVAEILPRLFLLEESGVMRTLPPAMPLLLTEGLAPQMTELLAYASPGDRPRMILERDRLYRVGRLVYPGPVTRVLNNYYRPPSPLNASLPVALLARMAAAIKARAAPDVPAPGRSIYLRRPAGLRAVLNQDELEAGLAAEGFEIVDAAALTAREQIALFAQCRRVVAPTGAAVTNILWCAPQAKVTVLHAEHIAYNVRIWSALAQAAGAALQSLACPPGGRARGRNGVNDDFAFPMRRLHELL